MLLNVFNDFMKLIKEEIEPDEFSLMLIGQFHHETHDEFWMEIQLQIALYLGNLTYTAPAIAILTKLLELHLKLFKDDPSNENFQNKMIEIFLILGRMHFISISKENPEEYFTQSLTALESQKTQNIDENTKILSFIGHCYYGEYLDETSKHEEAIKQLTTAVKLIEEIRESHSDTLNENILKIMIGGYSALARVYIRSNKLEDALENSKKAFEISQECKNLPLTLEANQHIIECYRNLGKYENALHHLEMSEKYLDEMINDENCDEFTKNHYLFQHFDQGVLVYHKLNLGEKLIDTFEDLMDFVKEKKYRDEDLPFIEGDYIMTLVSQKEISKVENFIENSENKKDYQFIYVQQLLNSDIENEKVLDTVLRYHEEGLSDYSDLLYDLLTKMERFEDAKKYKKSTGCSIL